MSVCSLVPHRQTYLPPGVDHRKLSVPVPGHGQVSRVTTTIARDRFTFSRDGKSWFGLYSVRSGWVWLGLVGFGWVGVGSSTRCVLDRSGHGRVGSLTD